MRPLSAHRTGTRAATPVRARWAAKGTVRASCATPRAAPSAASFVLLAGCNVGPSDGADHANVAVDEVRRDAASADTSVVPASLRIGDVAEEDAYTFGYVAGVAGDRHGRILVSDLQLARFDLASGVHQVRGFEIPDRLRAGRR